MRNRKPPQITWEALKSGLKSIADLISPFSSIIAAVGAVLSALGLKGAETPEFKFAMLITFVMCAASFMVVGLMSLTVFSRNRRYAWYSIAGLTVITVAVGIGAYRTTYESRSVDSLSVADQGLKILHMAFDLNGSLVAAEFNTGLTVRSVDTHQEWHLADWFGVENDRISVRSSEPQVTVTRLTGNPRKATISVWALGSGVVTTEEYQLGPSSKDQPGLACNPQDWVPDTQEGLMAIGYQCETAPVPQLAGGFVEIVRMGKGQTVGEPLPMSDPGPNHPEVPHGLACTPRQVGIDDVNRHVIGVYECIGPTNTHSYHAQIWRLDDGQFESWAPILGELDEWSLLALLQASDGSRIAAQHGSRVELWEPNKDGTGKWDLQSWLKFDPIYRIAPENVALSPDGKWFADLEASRRQIAEGSITQVDSSRIIAIQQFGVWFAGYWRTSWFDPLWAGLVRAETT